MYLIIITRQSFGKNFMNGIMLTLSNNNDQKELSIFYSDECRHYLTFACRLSLSIQNHILFISYNKAFEILLPEVIKYICDRRRINITNYRLLADI